MKSNTLLEFTPKNALKYFIIILLATVSIKYLVQDAYRYLTFDKAVLDEFFDVKWILYFHIIGGVLALIIGPFQFWKTFRNKYLKIHRLLGKIYLIAILIGVICSTILAWTVTGYKNFNFAFSLQVLAFAWFVTASMAYITIRRRRIIQHKEWMIRSYIVTFAFVGFRYLADLHILREFIEKAGERLPTIVWATWAIPILIAEVFMSWNKKA